MTGLAISGEELGKLVPFSISICHWLKDVAPLTAAEGLLVPLNADSKKEVENCLRQVIDSIENSGFELTNAQIKYIFTQYKPEIWALALKAIICKSKNPPVLKEKIKTDLVDWAYHFVKEGGEDWNDLFEEAGKILATLGHKGFQAFGEFCSLIRDCSKESGSDVVSNVVASEVLLPGKTTATRKVAAGKLLQKLVAEADRLFGQSGSQVGIVSFGVRSKNEVTQWNMVNFLPPEKKACQDLRTFYSFLDTKFVGIVDDLFEYHTFEDIAEAINNKYGMIPAPWKSKLNKMKSEGGVELPWFDYSTVKTPTPGASKNTKKKVTSPIPCKNPRPNDSIIDTLIDSEVNYYRSLSELGRGYVKKLLEITAKPESEQAMSLLINSREITFMFGARYQRILDLSHSMLTSLEVINLTRNHVKSPYTREQILAKVLMDAAKNEIVNAYGLYSSSYGQVAELLKEKRIQKKRLMQKGVQGGHPDFFKIWFQVRESFEFLKVEHLEHVLDYPIKRIHVYRKALTRLMTPHRSHTQVFKDLFFAYEALGSAADKLTKLSLKYTTQGLV